MIDIVAGLIDAGDGIGLPGVAILQPDAHEATEALFVDLP